LFTFSIKETVMKKNRWKCILIIASFFIALHGPMLNADDSARDIKKGIIAHTIVGGIRNFPLFPAGGAVPYWQNPNSPYYQPYYPYNPYYSPYGGPPNYPGSSNTSPYPTEVKPAGRLFIQIEPLDAAVMVDGYTLKQKDDLTYEVGLFTGIHHVEVNKDGFKSYKADVDIQPGMGTLITIVLEKLQK
jgi:hypothetical protein